MTFLTILRVIAVIGAIVWTFDLVEGWIAFKEAASYRMFSGLIAEARNHLLIQTGGATLLYLFGFFAHLVFSSNKDSHKADAIKDGDTEPTRECPHCAEIIKAKAILCKFCKSTVEPLPDISNVVKSNTVAVKDEKQIEKALCPQCNNEVTSHSEKCDHCLTRFGTGSIFKPVSIEQNRECPHCAETIKAEAIICRFCKNEVKPLFSDTDVNSNLNIVSNPPVVKSISISDNQILASDNIKSVDSNKQESNNFNLIIKLISLILLIGLVFYIFKPNSNTNKPNTPPSSSSSKSEPVSSIVNTKTSQLSDKQLRDIAELAAKLQVIASYLAVTGIGNPPPAGIDADKLSSEMFSLYSKATKIIENTLNNKSAAEKMMGDGMLAFRSSPDFRKTNLSSFITETILRARSEIGSIKIDNTIPVTHEQKSLTQNNSDVDNKTQFMLDSLFSNATYKPNFEHIESTERELFINGWNRVRCKKQIETGITCYFKNNQIIEIQWGTVNGRIGDIKIYRDQSASQIPESQFETKTLNFSHGKYFGEVLGDKANGLGTYTSFNSGSVYNGYFSDNKFYGYGFYTWKNGAKFAGEWKDDVGVSGKITYPDGTTSQGTVRNGQFFPAPGQPSRQPQSSTQSTQPNLVWNHNNSLMKVVINKESLNIYYIQPRQAMLDAGAKPNDLLVNGTIIGNQIKGTAKIFASGCGQFMYSVTGTISNNGNLINLNGQAPVVNRSNCQITKFIPDPLSFNVISQSSMQSQSTPRTP